MKVFENAVLYGASISSLSGEKSIPGSIKKEGARKKKDTIEVIDKKVFAPFNQVSTQLFRLCRSYGTRLEVPPLKGWVVAEKDADALDVNVVKLNDRFDQVLGNLMENLEAYTKDWALRNPNDEKLILQNAYTHEDLERDMYFVKGSVSLTHNAIRHARGYEKALEGLAGKTLREFSDQLRDQGVKDATNHLFTNGIRGVLGQIQRKAQSLAFLDPRIEEVSDVLKKIVRMLPSGPRQKVDDILLIALRDVVDRLLHPEDLLANGFQKATLESEDANHAEQESVSVVPDEDDMVEESAPAVVAKPRPPPPVKSKPAKAEESTWNADDEPADEDIKTDLGSYFSTAREMSDADAW